MRRQIWIGFDGREVDAFDVARASARSFCGIHMPIRALRLDFCRNLGLYRRPTETRDGRLWDGISDAPMATEFAISRFLTPYLAGRDGWALFVDCDVMFRRSPDELFDLADSRYAVMCVKHTQMPSGASMASMGEGPLVETKMDGQLQTFYARKNWSSVMLINLEHPGIQQRLSVEMVNNLPGRDLHRFCWLEDHEIGAIPPEWNHLVGVDPPRPDAACVHFTLGVPSMAGYEGCEHADEWRSWLPAAAVSAGGR